MSKKSKQSNEIASEIDKFFLQATEMLWQHVTQCYGSTKGSEKKSLSITEHFIIEFLGEESFASMSRLSQVIHVAPTTMTSIVDRLIKRGLLERHRAQQDRRKVLVSLSEKGKQLYEIHYQESLKLYSYYLNKFPDKGKQFRQNINELRKNIDYLKGKDSKINN
jgi:DNA-binding MarR family transcriptional regulator